LLERDPKIWQFTLAFAIAVMLQKFNEKKKKKKRKEKKIPIVATFTNLKHFLGSPMNL
jgi:hypothetical protein